MVSNITKLMAHLHLHVRGGPQVGEVTCVLGGRGTGKGKGGGGETGSKPGCPYNLLIYLDHVDMIDGVTRLGGLPGLLVRVILSSGVTICIVKVSR